MKKTRKEVIRFLNMFSPKGEKFVVYQPFELFNPKRFYRDDHGTEHKIRLETLGNLLIDSGAKCVTNINDISDSDELVFVDTPFNMNPREQFFFDEDIKVNSEINLLAKILSRKSKSGILFTLFPEGKFSEPMFYRMLSVLGENGFQHNIVLQVSNLYPEITQINLHLVGFNKTNSPKLITGELENNASLVYENIISKNNDDISNGFFVNKVDFKGFSKLVISEKIKKILVDYEGYDSCELREIGALLKSEEDVSLCSENLILVPKSSTREVVMFSDQEINDLKDLNSKYYLVNVYSDQIISHYVKDYLNTDIGKLMIQNKVSGSATQFIKKESLLSIKILYPSTDIQKDIIRTNRNLDKAQKIIQDLKDVINENPRKINKVSSIINDVNQNLGSLSLEDKILGLIKRGENKKIEFKETFGYNKHSKDRDDKNLIKASIKNIVAFLNTDGGNLIIGVHDSGEITGLDQELERHKNKDAFKLFFGNKVQKDIGTDFFYNYVDFQILEINDKLILNVECRSSDKACFYAGNEFYVRANPKAEKLEGSNLMNYTKERFG